MSKLLTISEAVAFLDRKFGIRPHRCTIIRWRSRGASGAILPSTKIGGRSYTSEKDLLAFVARLNAPSESATTPVMPPRQAEAAALKSAKKLRERLKSRKK